ncbi:MAG: hypothetical protein GW779_02235 [Candidatus Altiarchaeum hamiconexum]|uniref:TsaA-like domain-containing protein n=1 Tax=Candidatus Altarchaeum hamiconexum TaxID=1803513 RepID=A0A8J7YSB7_9ARCH|nr:hypothetical protein [Candidatus Altarchaeum hamiconexum]PIN66923.1 MAG: hypothetical protein COV98_05665 [Candidatus Altarchaeum sp. CG12_big_fil_rev_8_21_14_0_65_33_22]PIV28256.1 MAG: hypothetical protein COS36_02810 [Candidatus Altarchaeum sp. CG03_land_8_20_14_0_80_32_618]PIX49457.1 MAG: hypothetical protein COZ53_00570 [Candidatus Altarchaeum sp. CG_4_8_14_3_um_filter_33_2054]PIZ32405.1 MAG: hypothetical protein COY41_01070 [Candidatus Altarchaeum sp. CG_4_10_14_0_8_um_filter_32_851]PJ
MDLQGMCGKSKDRMKNNISVLKDNMYNLKMEPVGIIPTPYLTKEECPIQPVYSSKSTSNVEFDLAGEIMMVHATFPDDEQHGIYASKHPCRPNNTGISIVKLLKHNNNILTVEDPHRKDGQPAGNGDSNP